MPAQRRKKTSDLDAWLASLPLAALQCREMRHSWARDITPAQFVHVSRDLMERRLPCIWGCGCTHVETMTVRTYETVGKPTVRYPKADAGAYLMPKGLRAEFGRVPKARLRQEHYGRIAKAAA